MPPVNTYDTIPWEPGFTVEAMRRQYDGVQGVAARMEDIPNLREKNRVVKALDSSPNAKWSPSSRWSPIPTLGFALYAPIERRKDRVYSTASHSFSGAYSRYHSSAFVDFCDGLSVCGGVGHLSSTGR